MDLESPPYLFGVNRNHQFTTESFSAHGAASPYFESNSERPRVGIQPQNPYGRSPLLYNLRRHQEHLGFVKCKFRFCYLLVGARADPAARLLIFGTPSYLT
jgi:hypothetical protein